MLKQYFHWFIKIYKLFKERLFHKPFSTDIKMMKESAIWIYRSRNPLR